jgi:hypothetical protein
MRAMKQWPSVQVKLMSQTRGLPVRKQRQCVPYIKLMLFKPPNSEGIGPVSRLTLKSRTLRFLNEPIYFGIVPNRRLWSKYLSRN